jgi:protocatechuate 3,4-dioxygenase beta subunit
MVLVLSDAASMVQPARSANEGTAARPVPIAGKVTNPQGKPVEGATVTLYQMIYIEPVSLSQPEAVDEKGTGLDGTFTLTIPPGRDSQKLTHIVARKEGYSLGWAQWRVQDKQPLDIVLGEPKDLAGAVVDEKGQPVADVEVRITAVMIGKGEGRYYPALPSFLVARTDSQGHFLFTSMPADATFEFQATKAGRAIIGTRQRTVYAQDKYQFSPGQAGIKLVLPLEARIEGVVVEKTGGAPVGGVQVEALSGTRPGLLLANVVTTAQDGTFRVGGLTAGTYMVQLPTSREKTADWVAEPVLVSVRADETRSGVKLQLTKGGMIEVLVKDDNGKPVANASVSARHTLRDRYVSGASDENGLARLRVAAGPYVVPRPYREGYSRPLRPDEEQVSIAEGETKRIEYVLSPMPKLAGVVRDEAGRPSAGVQIEVKPTGRTEATSDASGRFEVTWDPASWGGQSTTSVVVARDVARNLAAGMDIDEQAQDLDIQLKPGVTIMGKVLSEEGKPLPGARLRVMVHGPRWRSTLSTRNANSAGPDGSFEIKALPADRQYTITAVADGYGSEDAVVEASDFKDNRCDAGQLKLPLANLSVSGIVVDPNDKPVAGAAVYVSYDNGRPGVMREVATDAEGKFTVPGLTVGPLRVNANVRGATSLYGSARAESGATDVRIIVSERRSVPSYASTPRRAASLRGKSLPSLKDMGIDLPAPDAQHPFGAGEGKMLLVCFWDMGQRPSRYCLTQLAARADPLRQKGVWAVAIHAGQVEDSALRQWIEANKIPFPSGTIAGDIEKTKSAWGVSSLPHLILTDKKHTVIAEGLGLDDLDKQIEAAVR